MPRMDKMCIHDETVTKPKMSKMPRINKMATVAKMTRVANGQNDEVGQMGQWLKSQSG